MTLIIFVFGNNKSHQEAFCGGTLIGARWVLTAAHCLRKRLYVRIGEYDLVEDDGTEMDFRVSLLLDLIPAHMFFFFTTKVDIRSGGRGVCSPRVRSGDG